MARITPDMPQRGAARNLLQVVDNYYRPARDRVGEAAMSQGFQAASNFLGNEAGKAKKQQLEEISLQAQQDALQGDDPDVELSKVRNGLLFRSNSRAYNQTYAETMGKKAAIEFKENATIEYEKSGMKYSTDPNKFREWMNGKIHGFLSDEANQNPYFLAGAMGYVEQTAFNMGATHMSNVSNQMEANHLAAIQKQADDMAMGIATGEIPLEEGLGKLMTLNSQAYGTGLSGPKSRSALISSWLTAADAAGNQEMLDVLLAAQESGELKLTPQEWNAVKDQGMDIERDINFRTTQRERAAKLKLDSELNQYQEIITDFYNNPDNVGVPLTQLLNSPVKDDGTTMGEMINASTNSTEIMSKVKAAYETVNTVYEIPMSQQLANNYAITEAYDTGKITNQNELMAWFQAAEKDGLRFNAENHKHGYSELKQRQNPEAVYNSQTYKDYKKPTLNRLINAMSPEGSKLIMDPFGGGYLGEMADDIKLRFQGYLDDYLKGVPDNNPEAIRAAITNAENSVMEFYRENDTNLFNKQKDAFKQSVIDGDLPSSANPYFAARLWEEQQSLIAEEAAIMNANRSNETTPFVRPDIDIQAGDAVLFGDDEPQTSDETLTSDEQAYADYGQQLGGEALQSEVDELIGTIPEANPEVSYEEGMSAYGEQLAKEAGYVISPEAVQARRDAVEAERAAIAAKDEADRKAIEKGSRLIRLANESVQSNQLSNIVLSDLEDMGVVIPTKLNQLSSFLGSIRQLEQRVGLSFDEEVLKGLLTSAQRNMRK